MKVTLNDNKKNNGIVLINYSNRRYKNAQRINTESAIQIGNFKKVISYGPEDIDESFYASNKKILRQEKGGGYWLWKPYFIKKALEEIKEGEKLFYCDSGSRFIDSVDGLIKSLSGPFDVIPFELQYVEKQWTKKDCFHVMNCDILKITDSKQRLASYSLWRKSVFAMKFVEEWLKYSQDERILTDIDNQFDSANYEGFIAHRHDQSIFSVLSKKYEIVAYRDPSQSGNNFVHLYPNSIYPQFLISTRQMDISVVKKIKKKIRPYLPNNFRSLYRKVKQVFRLLLKDNK